MHAATVALTLSQLRGAWESSPQIFQSRYDLTQRTFHAGSGTAYANFGSSPTIGASRLTLADFSEMGSAYGASMAIRLRDIARESNVSVITVSKALRGNTDIREATSPRVPERVKELDYQPNTMARSLATGHSFIVRLIAIKAALDAGLSVEEEEAIVDYENLRYLRYLQIPLTSNDQSTASMGESGATLVLDLVAKRVDKPRTILLTPSLVVRQSTVDASDADPHEISGSSTARRGSRVTKRPGVAKGGTQQ